MADEPGKIILGDTAIAAIEQGSPDRRFFRRNKRKQPPPKSHCENCGAELRGHWCCQCGQPAIDYQRSFRHVIVDVLDSFLNWDSKFFATIGLLLAKPWSLTNDFIAGKRTRYLHPLRLYILASIVFFFVINHWAKSIDLKAGEPSLKDRAKIESKLSKLSPEERAEIGQDLNEKGVPPAIRETVRQALHLEQSPPPAPSLGPGQSPFPSPASATDQSPSSMATASPPSNQSPSSAATPEDYGPFLQMGPEKPSSPFEKWLKEKAKSKIGEHGSNAELFLITLFNNLPYMMLCCIPLFALVLKILYVRGHIFYIDHLIYALHIHTFAYVTVMLLIYATIGIHRLPLGLLGGWMVAGLWILFAVQIFLSIRRVYRQGWFWTVFKFFFGGFVYSVVLFVALLVTFFVTLAT